MVLDRLQAAGLDGVSMAAAYHHSRDVFPHNPRHKVVYLEGGTTYFHPDLARYAGTRLKPKAAGMAAEDDPLATLVAAANRRRMHVAAWTVFLHNTRLAFAEPDCAPLTAFGDRLLNCLCPAHPDVRAYATALAGDVARYGVATIKLEALSYMPFDHGYHHERSFVRLSPTLRFLLGVCFCAHCLHAGARHLRAARSVVSRRARRPAGRRRRRRALPRVGRGRVRPWRGADGRRWPAGGPVSAVPRTGGRVRSVGVRREPCAGSRRARSSPEARACPARA